MSRSKQNGKVNSNIHTNRLGPSDADCIALAQAVEERFLNLCDIYFSVKGVQLVPPPDLDGDMLRWRQMRVRHKKGDFRHTDAELRSTRTVAQWTVDVNQKIRNQQSEKKIEWKD